MNIIRKVDSIFEKGVTFILVISLLAILCFSVMNIILRQFGVSFMWLEPFVRHLVFLATFLGGVLATGKGNHIGIDILKRFLEEKGKVQLMKFLEFGISLLCIFSI